MTSAYRTYVMGSNAVLFDRELIEKSRDSLLWWRLLFVYRSNWRVLHIDGLEGAIFNPGGIPRCTGERVQFFNYKVCECVKP
jgi:hypothetical protein